MTEFDELVKNGTASAVYKRYTHVSGGMLIDEEVEELKRRVEELERRLMGACPGPCRCPYAVDRRTYVGDTGGQCIDPWTITYY